MYKCTSKALVANPKVLVNARARIATKELVVSSHQTCLLSVTPETGHVNQAHVKYCTFTISYILFALERAALPLRQGVAGLS